MIRKFSIRLHEVYEDELVRVTIPTKSINLTVDDKAPIGVVKDMLLKQFNKILEGVKENDWTHTYQYEVYR